MIGYRAAHERVERERGKPTECSACELSDPTRRYEWASLTKNYEDVYDYVRLCVSCHRRLDGNCGGVGLKGSDNGMSILTESQVREIKSKLTGKYGEGSVLAREYGVGPHVIYQIRDGRSWSWI